MATYAVPPEHRAALVAPMAGLLARIPGLVRTRGLDYARGGRVSRCSVSAESIRAEVRGSSTYDVVLMRSRGALLSSCTCPAHDPGPCKHVAAVLFALGAGTEPTSGKRQPSKTPKLAERFPVAPLRAVATRISLYVRKPVPQPRDAWRFLRDHFAEGGARSIAIVLDAAMLAFDDDILADIDALRAWEPPAFPSREDPLFPLYDHLARSYVGLARRATLLESLPGPLDARHPGFIVQFELGARTLSIREKASPYILSPRRLAFQIPLDDATPPEVGTRSTFHGDADLWEVFALRALLLAMLAGDGALLPLARDLARPAWERILENIDPGVAPEDTGEGALHLAMSQVGPAHLSVRPYVRTLTTKTKKLTWRRVALDELPHVVPSSDETTRRLGRLLAGLAVDGKHAVVDARTPAGHEVLRALASFPRLVDGEPKGQETLAPMTVVADDLVVVLAPDENGEIRPVFRVGEVTLERDDLASRDPQTAPFVAKLAPGLVVSGAVAPEARPWVRAAVELGDALAFPAEALPKVTAKIAPHLAKGSFAVPREALGAELEAAMIPGLRVEWRPEGTAALELCVSVHPSAPLVAPARGPELFTFTHEGRRVFTEREFDKEISMLEAARDSFPEVVEWDLTAGTRGRTEDLSGTFALCTFLEAQGPALRIETRVGTRPSSVPFAETDRTLRVERAGKWLAVSGDVRLGDKRLSLGEVLEAVRLAKQYVPMGDGSYLEIPRAIRDKLLAVATATELAQEAPGDTSQVHEAFSTTLADVEDLFTRSLGFDVVAHARALAEARKKKRKVRPKIESGELRPYQIDGARWMLDLAEWAPGCILADDMGLGKTVQTAAVMLARKKLGPQLVVAPASVTSNWVAELGRFVPSLRVVFLAADREADLSRLGEGDVLVVSYGLLARVAKDLEPIDFATVVLDEAQFLKNALAQRSFAARGTKRRFTIALTGTPLENHLGELHALVDQVFPGLLGPEPSFRERFRRPIEAGAGEERLTVLSALLAPFLLRRTRKAVLEELPERSETTRFVELSDDEAKRYAALRRATELSLGNRSKDETAAQTRVAMLAALTRLRQIACDASLVDPTFAGPSTKLRELVSLASAIAEGGHKTLVFSQFRTLLEHACELLVRAGLRVDLLSGETPTLRRAELVASFQRGELDVLCVSLMAGGTGLNLTAASYVIHLDPWWNPAAEEQATSRAHRMGQTLPVTVIRLVSRGTLEEAILDLHGKKRDLAAAVLEGKSSPRVLEPEELLALVRFGG